MIRSVCSPIRRRGIDRRVDLPRHRSPVGECVDCDVCTQRLHDHERRLATLGSFRFDASDCCAAIEAIVALVQDAEYFARFEQERWLRAFLYAVCLVKRDAPIERQLAAFRELIPRARSAGVPNGVVERIKSACAVMEEGVRAAARHRELEAMHDAIQSQLDRFDSLDDCQRRALSDATDRLMRRLGRESRRVNRFYQYVVGGPLRVARVRAARPRSRRFARRARRVTACRRRQKDSGGSDDGPGEPPGPDSGSLVEACGVASARPGRPRDQTSTARFGERVAVRAGRPRACGRGPYPEAARVALRPRSAASEAPLGGPVRAADGGGAA
jgi:hypothetical protein